jgi:hypothetical protein
VRRGKGRAGREEREGEERDIRKMRIEITQALEMLSIGFYK